MKCYLYLCFLSVLVAANENWDEFKVSYNKVYKNAKEENTRHKIFEQNLRNINEHNDRYKLGLETYKKNINRFTDMNVQEFRTYFGLNGPAPKLSLSTGSKYYFQNNTVLTSSIDWRTKGAVTPVKNQGACGSCWSFSATGALEAQYKIKTGKLVSLSEQNLMDCSTKYGNQGCNGGWMESAFKYVQDYGINSEQQYPYEGADRQCRFSPKDSILRLKSVGHIKPNNEDDLLAILQNVGPISVAIHANENLQHYSSGIFSDVTCSKTNLNHGVLAIGFDNKSILIKNSWGSDWGEGGYVRFARGSNMCGIASNAVFPIL